MLIDPRFSKSIEEISQTTAEICRHSAEIRRHANGAIDLDHYVRIGREAHGAAVRGGGRSFMRMFRRLFGGAAGK